MWLFLLLLSLVTLVTSIPSKSNISLIETKWPQSCSGERREHVCLADSGHCSGLAIEGFCEFPQFCCFQGSDVSCKAKGACCQRKEYCTLKSALESEPHKPHKGVFTFYAGLCPASEVLQCCKEGGPGGEICYGQTDYDKCINKNATCGNGVSIHDLKLCPNKHTSCCLNDPQGLALSCGKVGGECTTTDHCASIYGSQSLPGLCPGSNIITCCVPPPSPPPPLPTKKPLPPIIIHVNPTSAPVPTTPKPPPPEKFDYDLDDCMSCHYLFDQLHHRQRYVSRQWYYTTLARLCGVEGATFGLGALQGGLPYRTDLTYNLYPTCLKLFGNDSPVIDDVITQLLEGWNSEQICHSSRLCVISSLELREKTSRKGS